MRVSVILPKWGMGIDEGTIVRWLKSEGELVSEGEALVEIESAKSTQEVEAPATGVLMTILVPEGETAQVNDEIAIIEKD